MQAYITEATAHQLANEIPLHIYEFPVEDPTKKYEGVSDIRSARKYANGYMPIAYNQSTIVSLEPVPNFCGYEPISYEVRTINPENPFERTLLERIIKESLLYTGQTKEKLKRVGNDLQEWKPKRAGKVLLYPAISFHVNVKNNRIHIGFDLTHKLEYAYTLQQMIENGESIYAGMKVIHSADRKNYSYEVERIVPYSVMEYCPLLKKSIYDYHREKK